MKQGEIVGPVETEFGYHLIKLAEVRGGGEKPFEEVRAAIESELKRGRAQRLYAEAAERLNNMVYEQSESLKPAAEQLKLQIQQSPWISRRPQPGSPLGNERFLKAVFWEDVLKNQRNSEVVEVAPGTLMAARLLEHKPAATRPFEEVRDEIRKRLIEEEAAKLASAAGREKLEQLRKGEAAGLEWSKPMTVQRGEPQGLSEPVLREVFRVDASKVPAYAGAPDPKGGYQIIRVTAVREPQQVSAEVRDAASEQLRRLIGAEQLADYVAAMKQRAEVQVKSELIENKQQ
jgi:peptidyl-prolyl cis-trans isomerase D